MKIETKVDEFKKKIRFVARAVPSKPEPLILGNILFEADHGKQLVYLSGFDGSFTLKAGLEATIDEDFRFVIAAKLLRDILDRLRTKTCTLSFKDEEIIHLETGKTKFQLAFVHAENYPSLPLIEPEMTGVQFRDLPLLGLVEGISACLPAVGAKETNRILSGICLYKQQEETDLELASTDSHRLAVKRVALLDEDSSDDEELESPDWELKLPIPSQALEVLSDLARLKGVDKKARIILLFNETQILFKFVHQQEGGSLEEFEVACSLLNGVYPPYRRLLPQNFNRNCTCDRKQLIEGLELIQVMATNKIVKFEIEPAENSIKMEVTGSDIGKASQEIPSDIIGDRLAIAFNIEYLIKGLKSLDATDIKLFLNEWNQPVVLAPNEDPEGHKYLLMPVQIRASN